ncbi:MAG: DNA polymerase III subunit delta' [Parvularculaceae bacterium]
MDESLTPPQERANLIGLHGVETRLRAAMGEGSLSHGWILAGPEGAGKATLAYRIARGLLDPAALTEPDSFEMPETAKTFRLVAAGAHPDLFVAERIWDDKKEKQQAEITIETIRKLTGFLNRTASGGGARVAIIDTADDMNRNAANALLKALEEPPPGAVILLLSAAPGRLLPTIRSRCRRIDLPPVSDLEVRAFLAAEGVEDDDAAAVTAHARGRPGYALRLATGEGGEALYLAEAFLKAAVAGEGLGEVTAGLSGRMGDERWPIFLAAVLGALSDGARRAAMGEAEDAFGDADAGVLLDAWQSLSQLSARGDALNLDRAQLVMAMAHDLRAALRGKAA